MKSEMHSTRTGLIIEDPLEREAYVTNGPYSTEAVDGLSESTRVTILTWSEMLAEKWNEYFALHGGSTYNVTGILKRVNRKTELWICGVTSPCKECKLTRSMPSVRIADPMPEVTLKKLNELGMDSFDTYSKGGQYDLDKEKKNVNEEVTPVPHCPVKHCLYRIDHTGKHSHTDYMDTFAYTKEKSPFIEALYKTKNVNEGVHVQKVVIEAFQKRINWVKDDLMNAIAKLNKLELDLGELMNHGS